VLHFQLDLRNPPTAILTGVLIALEDLKAERVGDFANLFFQADHLYRQHGVGDNAPMRRLYRYQRKDLKTWE
jgi:hypothetical protein